MHAYLGLHRKISSRRARTKLEAHEISTKSHVGKKERNNLRSAPNPKPKILNPELALNPKLHSGLFLCICIAFLNPPAGFPNRPTAFRHLLS